MTDEETEDKKKSLFESWYGMPVEENTRFAWECWCAAWDKATKHIAQQGNGDLR